MASCGVLHLRPTPFCHPQRCSNRSLSRISSPFLSCESFLRLKKELFFSSVRFKKLKLPRPRPLAVISASQLNVVKVLRSVWKVGRDGIDAGTDLVPGSVPRPIARISVGVVLLAISLFIIKSFLSVAFFVLATMGLVYFIFITLNKDEGPGSGGGTPPTDVSLEEARKIMEKYK